MPTRGQVCTWVAAIGLIGPSVAAGQDRSEREIVDVIVRDGPQAVAIRADVDVTRREQLARVAWSNPAVTYSREGAGFTEFLQAEQAFPWFGLRDALSKAGLAATAAAEAERDVRLWLLRSETAAIVARLVAEQTRLTLAEAQTGVVERLVEIVRMREREGEGSRFDRLRAEHELRETRLVVTNARASVAAARATLQGVLPPGVRFQRITSAVTPTAAAPASDVLSTRATETRAELRALEHASQRAILEGDAARRARGPAPSIFGGMKRADDGSDRVTGGVFGLSLSIPLFDTGSREAARWSAERARADAERIAVEARIRSEVAGAAEVLALRQAALADDLQAAASELAQIAEVAYREGDVGILEWLDAVRTASRAKARRVDLELDARLAQIALERAVGESLWP